jgi:Ca2+/Na+ antiporter
LLFGILQLTTPLMMAPMAVWMVIAYLATLGLEVVWLIKALRTAVAEQDAERKAAKAAEKEHPKPQDFTI